MCRLPATVAVLLLAAPLLADDWVGKTVMPKTPKFTFVDRGADGKQADIPMRDVVYTVVKEQDRWLRVRYPGQEARALKDEWVLMEDAAAHYTALIRVNPTDKWALNLRGIAWRERGEFDNAIKDFEEIIRLNPNEAGAFSNRGVIWFRKGEYDKAIADYSEANRLNATNPINYFNRSLALWAKKNYDEAIADLTEAIRLDPAYALAHHTRGLVRTNKREPDKSIADFTEAIRIDPGYAEAYQYRGLEWLDAKQDYDKAIRDFTEALRLEPKLAHVHYERGRAWREKKEYAKAVADYTEAIRRDPKDYFPLNNKATLLATSPDDKVRDGKAAVELALKACELSKWNHPIVIETLGEACAEAGEFEKAVKYQEQAIAHKDYPKDELEIARNKLATYRQKKPWREE